MTEQELVLIVEESNIELKKLIKDTLEKGENKEVFKKRLVELATKYELKIKPYSAEFSLDLRKAIIHRGCDWWPNAVNTMLSVAIKSNDILVLKKLKEINPDIKGIDKYITRTEKFLTSSKPLQVVAEGETFNPNVNLREYLTSGERGSQNLLINSYDEKVKQAMDYFKDSGLTVNEVDKAGRIRTVSIRNKAEMFVRYNERLVDCNKLLEKGIKYVVASSHVDASERCSYWQGKIFVLDTEINKTTGFYNKKTHRPNPTPVERIDGKLVYSMKEALSYGFLGYNCRHRLVEYKTGMDMPKQYTETKRSERQRIENYQREIERRIRSYKTRQVLSNSKQERQHWIERSKQEQEYYRIYCLRHNLVREDWRCSISNEERKFYGIKD